MKKISQSEFLKGVDTLAELTSSYSGYYGIPRGGTQVAVALHARTGKPLYLEPVPGCAVIDDICDSGRTRIRHSNWPFYVLCYRSDRALCVDGGIFPVNDWVVFPWEESQEPEDAVLRILELLGEDPTREGLKETPERVVRSWKEIYSGYFQTPESVLKTFNETSSEEMILLKDIELYSTCEHHMLPFYGIAHVAYLPGSKIVGASKLARLVEVFSRRLQIQERICEQVTDSLMQFIEPRGAACLIEARHFCISSRGVQKQRSKFVTSSLKGVFLTDPNVRNEFFSMVNGH